MYTKPSKGIFFITACFNCKRQHFYAQMLPKGLTQSPYLIL